MTEERRKGFCAKVLKAMSGWVSKEATRPQINRVWISGGALYATDSYRAVRVRPPEPVDVPDGTTVDPETFERMTAKDKSVRFTSGGVLMGRTTIPYGVPLDRIVHMDDILDEVSSGTGELTFSPYQISGVCEMAKATGKYPDLSLRLSERTLHASVKAEDGTEIDMVVMSRRPRRMS